MGTVVISPRDEVRQHFQELNKRKRAPGISDKVRESAAPVFIFNVYNREHQVQIGGNYGRVRIPACAPGEKFAGPVPYGGKPYIQGLLAAEYDQGTGDGQMGVIWEQGTDVALDVVGVGSSNQAPGLFTTDRSNWGVFISKTATRDNPVPSDDEIAEATRKLTANMMLWFDDGQRLAKEGHVDQIGPNHRDAAAFLNQKVDWSAKSIPMEVCPVCQEPARPGTVRHGCGAILDADKALENGVIGQEQYDSMAAAKRRRETGAAAPAPKGVPAAAITSGPVPNKPIRQQ